MNYTDFQTIYKSTECSLLEIFVNNQEKFAQNQALWVDGMYYTYADLFDQAQELAAYFVSISPDQGRCAILADRALHAYQSILAALFSCKAYLPLNPKFSVERNLVMLEIGNPSFICIDTQQKHTAGMLLKALEPTKICVFDVDILVFLKKEAPQHQYFHFASGQNRKIPVNILPNLAQPAYLMFTSGTTGKPKGISVTHGNLSAYVNAMVQLLDLRPEDRFSQLFELTFDLSAHELFVCWSVGATLYVVPDNHILGMKSFIQQHRLTHWMSVPSWVTLLHEFEQLSAHAFPSLRYSLFCGETFTQTQAKQWQYSACDSKLINLYGPTEATIAFTCFFVDTLADTSLPIVPIGTPLANQLCRIIDKEGMPCENGHIGELCLAGSQVVSSYWQQPEQTKKSFITFYNDDRIWYRTGDMVSLHSEYGLLFHGRNDDQWQIYGQRIEKIEIESALRHIAKNDAIAILPKKNIQGVVTGLILFVTESIDSVMLIKTAKKQLPTIMIPEQVMIIHQLPKNVNGKIDYTALEDLVKSHANVNTDV
ncbi:MAG: AMP-binding protein [Legionellales bacterium]|nr:AMP-binding protein [Legionellales bacterium]